MKHKKYFYIVFTLVLYSLMSGLKGQEWYYFTGQVVNEQTEEPVAFQPVFVSEFDSVPVLFAITNEEGVYFDSLFNSPSGFEDGLLVSTPDCYGIMQSQYIQYVDSLTIANFEICVIEDSCQALFVSTYNPMDPFELYFNDLSIGTPDTWFWEFGDGTNSSEQNPTHLYNSFGEYEVCLTISDSLNDCISTYCEYILVEENNCQADFSWYQLETEELSVTFEDQSTGIIDYWYWEFGDGQWSEDQSPTHMYDEPGQYLVTLFITDSNEICFSSTEQWVFVIEQSECQADFVAALDTLNNTPFVYQFLDESTGNFTHWIWDFGDGNFSEEMNPTHTYEQGGFYQVCLSIFSNDTLYCSDFYCETIETPNYYNFGGQVFLGDYPLNIEPNDSSNIAVASLYRRISNQWELMDTREFWEYGYYWFVDKPEGEYIVRTDLLPESEAYDHYSPAYITNTGFWENAETFVLSNSDSFSVNIHLSEMADKEGGIGSISGSLILGASCGFEMNLSGQLVYLLNNQNQVIAFTYTKPGGLFTFETLANGSYFIKAEVTGKQSSHLGLTLDAENNSQSGIELEVNCNAFVGLEETVQPYGLMINRVYPQPASSHLNIELSGEKSAGIEFSLSNIHGITVLNGYVITHGESGRLDIDVRSISAGLYILKLVSVKTNEFVTQKIIIN